MIVKVEEPEGEGDGKGKGDQQVQEALVGMVRLQAGKLRVTEFVDERSKLLTDIADQAKEEYDKIAEDAMRSMDEASSKVVPFLHPFSSLCTHVPSLLSPFKVPALCTHFVEREGVFLWLLRPLILVAHARSQDMPMQNMPMQSMEVTFDNQLETFESNDEAGKV